MKTVYRIFVKNPGGRSVIPGTRIISDNIVHTEDVAPVDLMARLRELEAKYPGHTFKTSMRDTLGN